MQSHILGQKRNAAYNNLEYFVLNESGKILRSAYVLLFYFRTFSHWFIEVSQSKPVYWPIFHFPFFSRAQSVHSDLHVY